MKANSSPFGGFVTTGRANSKALSLKRESILASARNDLKLNKRKTDELKV